MVETDKQRGYFLGVDLGGTKILAGVFEPTIECIGIAKVSTKAQRGPEAVIERIVRAVNEAVDECDLSLQDVRGIGIGAPGAVDPESGRVIFAANLGWSDLPLRQLLEEKLDIPVYVENDCNISTLGIYFTELLAKPRNMIGIFLGTGIGAGLIIGGKLYSGFNHAAGEVGHMVLQADGAKCACGNRGCFETLASRGAIFRKIQDAIRRGQKTILTDMLGEDLKDMRSGSLRKAIRRGDKFVREIVTEAARYTGIAVGNVLNILNPDVVVLGGGIIEALEDPMLPIIVETAHDHALPGTSKGIEIIASKLADNAGIFGGAVLARDNLN